MAQLNIKKPLITVAIDGYSSSGKSTMAKQLAKSLGYNYVDTGAMYRAVTLYALNHNLFTPDGDVRSDDLISSLPKIKINFRRDHNGQQRTMLNGIDVEDEIRGITVSNHVSRVAEIPAVRHYLVAIQQALGNGKGVVMDGRDIGTTVFPYAELKIFVNASPQTRAQRRVKEMLEKGQHVSYEDVFANVVSRDHIDETRAESPLRRAADAILLDNSNMSVQEQNKWLLNLANKKIEEQQTDPSISH